MLQELDALKKPEVWRSVFGDTVIAVFTTRQLPVPEGAVVHFYARAVGHALPELRVAAQDGTILVVGGGELASQFIAAEALDQLVFTVAPVSLATGAPVLGTQLESDRLTLTAVQRVGQFVQLSDDVSYAN